MIEIYQDYSTVISQATAIFALMAIDTILGTLAAWKDKRLNSGGAKKGLFKIAAYFGTWAGILTFGKLAGVPGTEYFSGIVVLYVAATELISILENAGKLGLKLPKAITNRLERLKDQLDDNQK